MKDDELIRLDSLGLIPGPLESEEFFERRASYCLNLREELLKEEFLKEELHLELKKLISSKEIAFSEILESPNECLKKMYGISINWVPIFFSNYKLSAWHGGAAWIFQMKEESPTTSIIQLRSNFRYRSQYLKIYSREELLTHELCHVGRMMFEEPCYEEIFAYKTSPSKFRRWFGPLFQSSIESILFLLVLFLIIVFDVFLVALQNHEAYTLALWLKGVPVLLILYGVARLFKRQKTLNKTIEKLKQWVSCPDKANYIAYRLSDKEIKDFSKMSIKDIEKYAHARAKEELRWKLLVSNCKKCLGN